MWGFYTFTGFLQEQDGNSESARRSVEDLIEESRKRRASGNDSDSEEASSKIEKFKDYLLKNKLKTETDLFFEQIVIMICRTVNKSPDDVESWSLRAITKVWASIYFEQEELKEQDKKFKREQEQNNG